MKRMIGGLLAASLCAMAQGPGPSNAIVGSGYLPPAPVSVAPGQVMTFYLAATGVAIPSFAGVTATVLQGTAHDAPVLSVKNVSTCPSSSVQIESSIGCSNLNAVTVQIPYELTPFCPACEYIAYFPPPWLYVSFHGAPGTAIELNALADQVHILTGCDVLLQTMSPPPPVINFNGLPCAPLVTHGNGTMVSAANPAKPGEALTAWATGLGATDPFVPTGQPATAPVKTAQTLRVSFDYEVNALAVKPRPSAPAPAYSGLVPGFVGLYQINFVVPPEPAQGMAQCAGPGTFAPGANVPQSNLTVSFGGVYSFDGAGICVATHVPVD